MRIVHTCLRYPPATGGVETYVEDIVERTRDIRHNRDVRVLTSRMRTHGPISELSPEMLLDDPIYIQRLHHASTPFVSYPRLQALSYYIGHHKPEILHGYSFWYQPADVAARYARKNNIPFFFHPIYYENSIRRKPLWQVYKKLMGAKTFSYADVVFVLSPFEQSLIEKAGFQVKRFEMLPPSVNIGEFTKQRPNPFHARGIYGNVLLTVSRLAQSKGIDDVVKALSSVRKKFPDIHLVVVGEDFGALESLREMVTAYNLERHVHFLGKLNRDDLVAAYMHADIFVHASHYEAFGIVVAEALAAGTPVVGRNSTAIPFVSPHEQTGLLFSDTDELSDHIQTLLHSDSLRTKYGAAGKERVKNLFSWDVNIKKLTGLYSEFSQ